MRQTVIEAATLFAAATTACVEPSPEGLRIRWHGQSGAAVDVAHVDDDGYLEPLDRRSAQPPVRVPRERYNRRILKARHECYYTGRAGSKWNHGRKSSSKFRFVPSERGNPDYLALLEEARIAIGDDRHPRTEELAPKTRQLFLSLLLEENVAGTPPVGFSADDQAQFDAELAAIELGFDI